MKTCKICGKKYVDVGSIPDICLSCWDKRYHSQTIPY